MNTNAIIQFLRKEAKQAEERAESLYAYANHLAVLADGDVSDDAMNSSRK